MTMAPDLKNQTFRLGSWAVDPESGTLTGINKSIQLEPKVMELLTVLAMASPRVVPRDDLVEALWPDSVVGEDALARCVLKLRRALGDEAQEARYVETLRKRGYRLLQTPEPAQLSRDGRRPWVVTMIAAVVIAAAVFALGSIAHRSALVGEADRSATLELLERAHDHYYQFTRQGNEAAAALYERLLESDPDFAPAKVGMANVLVQRIVRWPEVGPEPSPNERSVFAALKSQRISTPWAMSSMARAIQLADAAVRSNPDSPQAHKALGLALSLAGEFDKARNHLREALSLNPEMWESWINLGELNLINDEPDEAIENFVRAYEAMGKRYAEDAQRIGNWQAELGAMIGDTLLEAGRTELAEQWYRRVLEHTPYHVGATLGLASVREQRGDLKGAQSLCDNLVLRIGPTKECGPFLTD